MQRPVCHRVRSPDWDVSEDNSWIYMGGPRSRSKGHLGSVKIGLRSLAGAIAPKDMVFEGCGGRECKEWITRTDQDCTLLSYGLGTMMAQNYNAHIALQCRRFGTTVTSGISPVNREDVTVRCRRKPGSFNPLTCAGSSSLLFVGSCLLNQLLPPVNAPSDSAGPGKCQQRVLCGS